MNKSIRLNYELTFSNITDLNESFAKATCLIAYTGKNQNMSSIEKDVFEKALPSIKNIPIVGRYDRKTNTFGSHDLEVIKQDDKMYLINATTPFGVVPESAKQWWEDCEVNGETKHCLFTEVILWKRQHGYQHIKEAKTLGQSMEIEITDFSKQQDGYTAINAFYWKALCILESAKPCFENANITHFTKAQINHLISQFQQEFSMMTEQIKQELGGFTLNTNKNSRLDTFSKLASLLEKDTTHLMDFDESHIYYQQYQPDTMEKQFFKQAYKKDTEGNYVLEDKPIALLRQWISQEDFNKIKQDALSEFEAYKQKYPEETFKALEAYKIEAEAKIRSEAENTLFQSYDDMLKDSPEYQALKEKKDNLTIEELEKECLMLVGKYTLIRSNTTKPTPKSMSFQIVPNQTDEKKTPYGGMLKHHD